MLQPPRNARFATFELLSARRSWVLDAPKDNAPILTLCVRPAEGERRFVQTMQLDPERGVVGDRWLTKTWMRLSDGRPDPRIQVCIMGSRLLELVRREGADSMYPGDNVIADMDFSEANLPVGQHLQLGTAIIEVSDVFNSACSKWQQRYGADALTWINLPENKPHRLRGILARVVRAGEVHLTDSIRKCERIAAPQSAR